MQVYNTSTLASATITTRATHFGIGSRQLYVVHRDGTISLYNLQGAFVRTLPIQLPGTPQDLLVTPDGRVAIIVEQKLFIVRDDALVEISQNVLRAQWSPDGRILLVQPDTAALYVYNEADERSTLPLQELQLVTRLSRPITSSQWFAGGQHLLYQVDDELRVIEIDTRDHAIEEIIDTTNLGDAHAAVGQDGETILYLKRESGQTNLVIMPLIGN